MNILYRVGRDNTNADALSRQPHLSAPTVGTADDDVQVLSIGTGDELDISSLYSYWKQSPRTGKTILQRRKIIPITLLRSKGRMLR